MLLDTHALLWFVLGDAQLSATARSSIEDPQNDVLISPAGYWEIAIKINIGKYSLPQPYEEFLQKAIGDNGFLILPIELSHTAALINLPFHHRDPFDRLLIAQAMVERIPVVSADPAFDAYPIARIW